MRSELGGNRIGICHRTGNTYMGVALRMALSEHEKVCPQ